LKDVIADLQNGEYHRAMFKEAHEGNQSFISTLSRGSICSSDYIKFEDVPIISPNGDILVEKLSFEVSLAQHTCSEHSL
jgi:ATP-binding cassette subfamily D (ALD) long-chain fatty acid import protein